MEERRKVYVEVRARHLIDGTCRPETIMGHADITTTMDIYNEATKDKKMESFAGLEGKIKIR